MKNYIVPLMRPSLPDKEEFKDIINELWETRMLSNFSKYATLFEERAKEIFGSRREFRSVVSCDIGLTLMLKAYNFPAGSEVLVPSFTFNSTINAVLWNNLVPVYVDIDDKSFCMDVSDAESKVTNKTVAILATHIFGFPADCINLTDLANEHRLKLFFDCAHAFGTKLVGVNVCEFGDAGVFSFSGTKLVTSAEGGLAYFKDPEIARKFSLLRQYGFERDYNTKVLGLNGKISELHAGLAWLSIKNIDKIIKRRHEIANMYRNGLKNCYFQEESHKGDVQTYKDFAVLVANRDYVCDELEAASIQTKKYFMPNHTMDLHRQNITLNNTEEVYSKILCLPIFNDITDDQVQYVVATFNSFVLEW